MTTRLGFVFALGLVMGLALSIQPAQAETRPAELGLFTMLNGEVSREMNTSTGGFADGGGLTLWSIDAGPGCNNVATGAVYEMHCNAAGRFCPWGTDGGAGLAFCGTTIGAVGYGKPVNASTETAPAPYWFVTAPGAQGATKNVCIVPAAGSVNMTCALFRMR
jgi:hypothetical protein